MRRRDVLRLAGVVPAATLTAWLAGCDPEPTGSTGAAEEHGTGPRDLLVVRTDAGIALVDANLGRIVADPRAGVAGVNGFAFATSEAGARTTVDVARTTGRPLFQSQVDGRWQARSVSADGSLVALADVIPDDVVAPDGSFGPVPYGRSSTTIVLADAHGERRRYVVPGCVEPEAFSTTGDYLYSLDFLPPEAPDRYRVRALNLATGDFEPLQTRDKQVIPAGAEEEMRGEGRQAVYVPGLEFLFTLYTHQPDHDHTRDLIAARSSGAHAFVHSLSLVASFAYCIDLPAPFGDGPAEGHVIAVAPDRQDPLVVDTTSGTVAELDGSGLGIRSTARIPADAQAGPAAAVLNGLLFLGRGTRVRGIRPEGYGLVHEWTMPSEVRGLGLSANRERLWVGQTASVVAYEVATGRRLGAVKVPGLVNVEAVGAKG